MSGATGNEATTQPSNTSTLEGLQYVCYGTNKESPYLPAIRQLISKDLSEPYSVYVYRYFLYQWGELCFMVCLTLLERHTHSLNHFRLLTTETTSSES